MLIIQIETATSACSVALAEQGNVIACREIDQRNVHAEKLTVFIGEVMALAGKSYRQLDAVAVSCGPGSYTGLRIGVSTAKGLCFALDKPLIAVETLSAMADGFAARNDCVGRLLCPMIDARRMEVFTAVFDRSGQKLWGTSAEIINEHSFAEFLDQRQMVFFGDGAAKCREILRRNSNALISEGFINSASDLSRRALEKYRSSDFEDVAYFEPYYLKDFVAGRKAG